MNIILHLAIQDLASKLHSGKIDPHGEDLAMRILEVFKPHIVFDGPNDVDSIIQRNFPELNAGGWRIGKNYPSES